MSKGAALLNRDLLGFTIGKRKRRDDEQPAYVDRTRIDELVGDCDRPPQLRVPVKREGDVRESLAFDHGVGLAEIRGLPIDLFGLALFIYELVKGTGELRSNGPAVVEEHLELLADSRQYAAKLERRPGEAQDRRRVQLRIDLHQLDDLLGLVAYIAGRTPLRRDRQISIEEKLHLESSQIAVHELQQRRAEAGDALRSEVIVLVQCVLFRVEHHLEPFARVFNRDLSLRQCHSQSSSNNYAGTSFNSSVLARHLIAGKLDQNVLPILSLAAITFRSSCLITCSVI